VIEGKDEIIERHHHVRNGKASRGCRRQALQMAAQLVSEKANGAAHERHGRRTGLDMEAGQFPFQHVERVARCRHPVDAHRIAAGLDQAKRLDRQIAVAATRIALGGTVEKGEIRFVSPPGEYRERIAIGDLPGKRHSEFVK
jgi:hypothetical protein